MAEGYSRITNFDVQTHFSAALQGQVESSRMIATPEHLTTFNAGDIIPIYCAEVLPDDQFELSVDAVIRQATLKTPTMGSMEVDIYAFFVPNRIVNRSFKATMGENYNGSWTASSVTLAPLVAQSTGATQIPVGSVADYYGFPTQQPIPNSVLSLCHDLKFRGYVMIYNERFRDQNYQPPLPFTDLNVFQGYLTPVGTKFLVNGILQDNPNASGSLSISGVPVAHDGSFGAGAVGAALFGSARGQTTGTAVSFYLNGSSDGRFHAYDPPLKANKLHDYFTSVLPSPEKGASVFVPLSGVGDIIPVTPQASLSDTVGGTVGQVAQYHSKSGTASEAPYYLINGQTVGTATLTQTAASAQSAFTPSNLGFSMPDNLQISIEDLRMSAAIQQVFEALARGGSRYREYVRSFFGLEVDDPYSDIPQYLGHIRRTLDLYQTAQTSASVAGSTPQGNLAAFGYTSTGGQLFPRHRFLEHGYLHVLAVVRHKNVYPSYMGRDNFRLSMLDFYQPQLANISEQPVFAREVNPFSSNPNAPFGYQEAWAEYRFEPNRVSGLMRPGVSENLSVWNYADEFDSGLQIADDDFIRSNSQEVLDRTLAQTSEIVPQFLGQFRFKVDKTRPLPTYSVPGLDII